MSPPAASILIDVSAIFRRQLENDPKGQTLLRSFGITSPETINAFQMGYSDGRLGRKANPDFLTALQSVGLVTHNRLDVLGRSIVIPALDPETGAVVDFHAIRQYQRRKRNLFSPPRGLLNPCALEEREWIVTDWLEAALRIHQAGWRSVWPLRSLAELKSHRPYLLTCRPRRIWVASAKHGKKLIAAFKDFGCEVRHLKLHHDVSDISSETLKRQMESAGVLQHQRPPLRFLDATADSARFLLPPDVNCEVTGLQGNGNTSKKIALTLSREGQRYVDRLDLLAASARQRLAKKAGAALHVDAAVLETALLDLADELGRRVVQLPESAEEVPPDSAPIPEARREDALALLKSPQLVDSILDDLEKLGLAGERENAVLLLLVAVSRKLKRPLSAILRGESAAGKSNLVERVSELIPPDEVLHVSRLTANALFYLPPGRLAHRLLIVEEREGSAAADYAVRILQSRGELKAAVPVAGSDAGQLRTRLLTVSGPVAYIETTNRMDIDPQNLNRCFEVRLDESPEQTARILKARSESRSKTHDYTSRENILRRHHDAQRMLTPATVLIPYASLLTFPSREVRFRRDHERLLGLIDASAVLFQHQRQWRTTPRGERVLVADVDDYRLACRLIGPHLARAVDELSPSARQAYQKLAELEQATRRELMAALGWKYNKTFLALAELRRLELVGYERGKGTRPSVFRSLGLSVEPPEVGLIDPERLARLAVGSCRDPHRQQAPLRTKDLQ